MKYSQPMTIAYDISSHESAVAYRAMLEYYTHNVALVRLDSEEAVRSFLGFPPRSALTLLICHGWGKTEAEAMISLEITRPVDRVHHERFQFDLTPARLAELVDHGAGDPLPET